MEKYKDYKVAVRDLYLSTVGCVHYAGEKMVGHMHYLCQSHDPRRARPDEAKRLTLRTRGQGVTAGWG